METWRVPGNSYEVEKQIWISLDNVFRDAGITLWPYAVASTLEISEYPSSSGFGYAIPTRGEDVVGSVADLCEFEYSVCSFTFVYSSLCLTFTDRIHACELHVPEMDLM